MLHFFLYNYYSFNRNAKKKKELYLEDRMSSFNNKYKVMKMTSEVEEIFIMVKRKIFRISKLIINYYLLFIIYYLLFIIYYLLFIIYYIFIYCYIILIYLFFV